MEHCIGTYNNQIYIYYLINMEYFFYNNETDKFNYFWSTVYTLSHILKHYDKSMHRAINTKRQHFKKHD